ncbi:hypothetical protein GG804_12885 [Sphingomonas histidinilytica]|uniref:hypothetical protein n=1 Tax=Rhizorhabdus histidinilytica TaxID=439228 RepID=UPI001ADC1A01|nr:hypothetical protein [Rhizorhabdus histidinilytica]MBO9377665.1 hypothetical protein [Rhizorhabdus histidinilytica]
MSPWIEGLLAKYGAVALGVSIGTAAKYGLTMGEGRKITRSEVISDLLIVPFLVLLAAWAGARFDADPMTMTTVAAFIAVSSDRVIRMLRERFIERLAAEMAVIDEHKGQARQLSQIEQSSAHAAEEGLNAPTAAAALVREIAPNPPQA